MNNFLIFKSTVSNSFFCAFNVNLSTFFWSKTIGKIPFLKQLLKNMSAKTGAIKHLIPKSKRDQGACSRLLPQPKLSPVIKIDAFYKDPAQHKVIS